MKNNYTLIVLGTLFILATIAYLLGSTLLEISLTNIIEKKDFDFLMSIFGIILEFINIFSVIAIGILFQLLLKQYNSKLSIIYLVSRILEGFFLLLSVISILPLLFDKMSTVNPTELIFLYNNLFQIGMLFLGVGSLFLLTLLKKEKIIGNILFVLGVISYVSLFSSSILELLNIVSNFTLILYLPGTVFEIVFPLWLVRKGGSKNESNKEIKAT